MKNEKFKRKKIIIFFLIFWVLTGVPLHSQQTMKLTPDEAVQLAIKNNLSLETTRTNVATKKRTADLWWNQFIPSVTVAGSMLRDNKASTMEGLYPVDLADAFNPMFGGINQVLQPFGLPANSLVFPSDTLYGVVPYSVDIPQTYFVATIQASVSISFAMFEGVKSLKQDYEAGLIGYEKARLQLERDIRKEYHNLLLIQENIALLRATFANVERQVQMAQANYNAGLAPELVLLQARVGLENMRPIMDQAENGYKLALAMFAMKLDLDYNTEIELMPVEQFASGGGIDFISLDVSEMISKAASQKPDIRELRQTITMMQSAKKAQLASLTPAISFSWNNNSVFMPFDEAKFFTKDDWNSSGAFTISVGMRLHSLIPWSPDFQNIKKFDDQITTTTLGLAQLVRGTEIEVYNTVLALERTRITAEVQAQTVSLAEQSYRLTEQAYQAGLQDYFQVQNAQQSLHQARVQMLEQQFNYLNGLLDLEYSIGVPFGTLSSKELSKERR